MSGQVVSELMQSILSVIENLAMQLTDLQYQLDTVFTAFLTSCELPLQSTKLRQTFL